jgi:peptidoglycan/xylan/chitin deacetylase (PgdA/CDA1 family)
MKFIVSLVLHGVLLGAFLAGCSSTTKPSVPAQPASSAAPAMAVAPPQDGAAVQGVVGRHDRLLVAATREGDTLQALALRFLGSASHAWRLAQANPTLGERLPLAGGRLVVVPLLAPPAHGVSAEGVQTVPILCYHRFGSGPNKMMMSPLQFEAQLQWLAREGYKVLRLSELQAFLAAREAPPPRSVLITVDDGYESFHRHAFPLLRKYGMPATLFVYSDIVGRGDGLNWTQLRELAESGLVDIQAHSKTHRNFNTRQAQESEASYRHHIGLELRQPRQLLEQRLASAGVKVTAFAYPYGESNDWVVQMLPREGYSLGFTVHAGGNPFYASPRLLRRTMIYGDSDLEDFKTKLQIQRVMPFSPPGASALGAPTASPPASASVSASSTTSTTTWTSVPSATNSQRAWPPAAYPMPTATERAAFAQQHRLAARGAAAQSQHVQAQRRWDILLALLPDDREAQAGYTQASTALRVGAAERLARARSAQARGDTEGAERSYLETLAWEPENQAAAEALRALEHRRGPHTKAPSFGRAPV